VLSVPCRVQWMHPDRRAVLTRMSQEQCDAWVAACAARGLVVPAARRWVLLRHAELTASGLAWLDAWTVEFTRRAAGG